jgi:plastocyanin
MEGIIWVQGSISGLPSSGTNLFPDGKDHFSIEFLAITQGGTISWHNQDTDAHNIASVVGWSAPVNPTDLGSIEVKGTESIPNGETRILTFNKPGLYYYYCTIHASVNSTWHRAQASTHASLFPIPMEGFILVV